LLRSVFRGISGSMGSHPLDQRNQVAARLHAAVREAVLHIRRHHRPGVPVHQAVGLQCAESLGEHFFADATHQARELTPYTGVVKADTTTLVLGPEHKATEEAVIASGLTYTLLRNGWYTENYAAALEQARQTGKVVASAGSGRIASASRSDYAAAAAAVLSTDGHDNAVYELSGDVAWDFEDLAASFGAALDRPVSYEPVEPGEHLEMLKEAGLDEQTAGFLVALDGNIRDGELAAATGDLSRLTGRPTVPLSETFARLS
jgi:NAD(P)H dehydrogenase (quinone)